MISIDTEPMNADGVVISIDTDPLTTDRVP